MERRRLELLEELAVDRWTPMEEIAARTGASPATIRRDLRALEAKNFVRREHGAVRLAESPTFEPFLDDPGFREQLHRMAREKRRIGAAAASLIEDGATVGISAGTTSNQIARELRGKKNLTVVTNALHVAMELSREESIRVHLSGGYLSGSWFALVGPRALEFAGTLFTDKFFFGANGVHAEHGVTDQHTEEAAVNQALARQARQRILVVDHTKFGKIARCLVCPIREVNMILTDTGASDEMIAPFQDLGIQVLRV
ncbi:MAG TPA: DeoR/GlpR family DNA-binding transcription regulator [Bryobacteraceae bacterium]|nr:DeoR/GlpR family DNA-binding transcription regulator [Bryobacteraceae bacterium]